MIADALEIVRDLERRGDEAQVAGERLLERQQAQAVLVDGDLHAVDRAIVGEHLVRQRRVAPLQRLDGFLDDALGAAAHAQQLLLQRLELVDEVSFHGQAPVRRRPAIADVVRCLDALRLIRTVR